MLNEPASALDDHPQLQPQPEQDRAAAGVTVGEIRAAVETVLAVEEQHLYETRQRPQILSLFFFSNDSRVTITYKGRLLTDSETAYAELDAQLSPHDLLPVFRSNTERDRTSAPHIIHIAQGRIQPGRGGQVLSLILLALTLASVLFVGAQQAIAAIDYNDPVRAARLTEQLSHGHELWRGLPYAISIMLILGTHEMGHYLTARRHRIAASLPYFLPFPVGFFGTLGAAIRLREPIRNRKMLLDLGAAGPLVGMFVAIPILLIGLATSPINAIRPGGYVEGNSVLYALSKIIVLGRFLPDGQVDVYINQLAMAGWTGLLITGLNLIPLGQLDGGHVLYALLGKYARKLYYPVLGALMLLALRFSSELIIFVLLLMFMGNYNVVPLDDITPLDRRRRALALVMLVLFLLVFVPMPFSETVVTQSTNPLPSREGDSIWLPVLLASLWLGRRSFRFWGLGVGD